MRVYAYWRTRRAVNIPNVLSQWTIIVCSTLRWRRRRFHVNGIVVCLRISHATIRESRWIYDISRTKLQAHLARRQAGTRRNYAVLDTLLSDNVVALHAYIHHVLMYVYLHTLVICARVCACVNACDSLIIQLVKRNSDFGDPVARLLATVLLTRLVAGQCPTREKLVSFDYFV